MSDIATNSLTVLAAPEMLDLIQKVDAFYNTSWNHLLIYSGIIITTIGILLPLLIQWFQTRSINREEQASIAKLNSLVADAQSALTRQLNADAEAQKLQIAEQLKQFESMLANASQTLTKTIDDKIKATRGEIDAQVTATTGSIYHVQGGMLLNDKNYGSALQSYLTAVLKFAAGHDELNLRRALSQITTKCLPALNKDELGAAPEIRERIKEVEKAIEPLNENGRYQDALRDLQTALRSASERSKPA